MKKFLAALLTILITIAFSCKQIDLYELHTNIPNQEWNSSFSCNGNFLVSDTTSLYNIYLIVRHTDAYAYNNIWINLETKAPGDSINVEKINLELGDDKNGWYGIGMGDIWETRKKLTYTPCKFKKFGSYSYKINNIMRDDPLKSVLSVGMRVQKVEN